MGKAKLYKDIDPELPFLLISGESDPCTGGEKGRKASYKVLQKAGYKNIKVGRMFKEQNFFHRKMFK